MTRPFLRTSEAAALLGCSVQYVARRFRSGHLPGERKSERGMWRIRRSALRDYAAKAGVRLDWEALDALTEARRRKRLVAQEADQPSQRSLSLL